MKSYRFQLPLGEDLDCLLHNFTSLTGQATRELLTALWSESWIDRLGESSLPGYKEIGEHQVQLVKDGRMLYLPSRIRRGIAEQIGRILRSQYKRKQCFKDVQSVLQTIGLTGNLDRVVKHIALTIQFTYGRYYRWQMIRQTVRMLRFWGLKHKLDMYCIPYTALVRPSITRYYFPYAVDDGQIIKYEYTGPSLKVVMKLPKTDRPYAKNDWSWSEVTITVPEALQERIKLSCNPVPHLPILHFQQLKGGLVVPTFQFAWDFPNGKLTQQLIHPKRALAVDLGLVNLATSVIFEAGYQITRPTFYRVPLSRLQPIERLYTHLRNLQKKMDRLPVHTVKQGKRRKEFTRIQTKIANKKSFELHSVSKHLIQLMNNYGCETIIFEDLRTYFPPKGLRSLSRRLSEWFRGSLVSLVEKASHLYGWKLKRVNPRGTSSYCPRCTTKGLKVSSPDSITQNSYGRHFYCSHCQFRADRDYVGAVNVYRVFACLPKLKYHISQARAVLYMSHCSSPNRSGEKSSTI